MSSQSSSDDGGGVSCSKLPECSLCTAKYATFLIRFVLIWQFSVHIAKRYFGRVQVFKQPNRLSVSQNKNSFSLALHFSYEFFYFYFLFNRMWVTYIVRHSHSKPFEVLFVCFVCTFLWTFRVQFSIKCTTKERKWEIPKANTLFGLDFYSLLFVIFFFFFFSTLLCRSIFQGFSFWTSHSHSHTHITHHNTNHLVRIELCQFNFLFFLNLYVFMLWLLFFFICSFSFVLVHSKSKQ